MEAIETERQVEIALTIAQEQRSQSLEAGIQQTRGEIQPKRQPVLA